MKVIVFNCGSSSIKYQLFEMPEGKVMAKGIVQRIGERLSEAKQTTEKHEINMELKVPDHHEGMAIISKMLTDPEKGAIKSMSEIDACGHRVVHGGEAFTGSVLIDEKVEQEIERHCPLAPLHNPANLIGIRESRKLLPGVPQIACFDTAFHQTIPEVAYTYALPRQMYEQARIRRYGFHGISHRYVSRRVAELLNMHKYAVNLITCHLGNGCSITAVKEGKSVDTSMGLTPLEGLVMGTRTGDIDPAIIFYLVRQGYEPSKLDTIFNKQSGLLGLSGISNDVRDLEQKADEGHKLARLALEVFAYRVKKYIGAYLAVLNGCHAIVFTGGIGENGYKMRKRIINNMQYLGLELDDSKNMIMVNGKEGEIQSPQAKIKIFVIHTDEERAIANDTYLLATKQG
jgi:acetate kinase